MVVILSNRGAQRNRSLLCHQEKQNIIVWSEAMSEDMGVSAGIRVKTDASAAKGIASRRGLGKVRHIDVSQLWLQDRVSKGEIVIEKVSTHDNLADAMTKHVDGSKLNSHMLSVGLVIEK